MKPRPKQPLAAEIRDSILDLIRTKFYSGHAISFAKDRPRLLSWVVLYPASWLNERGVTLQGDRYRAIMSGILIDAAAHLAQSKVTYLPAYLRQVIQSHWRIHGETYYEEAKSMRNLVEHAVIIAGKNRVAATDPVRELAQAASLLKATKSQKRPKQAQDNSQLNLL
jgi:hypothetical protein